MTNARQVNAKLIELFSNGKGECGLEAGQDPGLTPEEYIQIPKCMSKAWVAHMKVQGIKDPISGFDYDAVEPFDKTQGANYYIGKPGYISSGVIRVNKGILEGQLKIGDQSYWVEVDDFLSHAPTADDMMKFYTVNIDHVRDKEFSHEIKNWIISVRFWAVVAGFVTSSKSNEFVIVNDPQTNDPRAQEFVDYAMNFCANSWTACAARATSWRKTNHCTGGDTANGFPKRWLVKEGFWKFDGENKLRSAHEKRMTAAFYVASHGVSSHAVLAMMAPQDPNHWAVITPSFGFIPKWEVGPSVSLRMIPNSQVAGTAIVIDSMVVLRMLTSEGISPLINNLGQLNALINAAEDVSKKGMRCAVYAKWYFEGFFKPYTISNFSQRDSSFIELVSELAIIAQKYYKDSTIAGSAALQNLANQSAQEGSKQSWAALSSKRRDIKRDDFFKAFDMIKGNTAAPMIQKLTSKDLDVITTGVEDYNNLLKEIGTSLGIDHVIELKVPNRNQQDEESSEEESDEE